MEEFFGVYLLYNVSDKYEGRVYIGFTVNPDRRISQHNKGIKSGGARRTNNKGPWEMVLIVHGFLNEVSALRFEWAWQNPSKSRRLKHVPKKKSNERVYNFKIRVLSEMLLVGPWTRLPLTIRWLKNDRVINFPVGKYPPSHMSIVHGPFVTEDIVSCNNDTIEEDEKIEKDAVIMCFLCKLPIPKEECINCWSKLCGITTHIVCLSINFTNNSKQQHIIPISGNCPKCFQSCSWADLVKKQKRLFIKSKE